MSLISYLYESILWMASFIINIKSAESPDQEMQVIESVEQRTEQEIESQADTRSKLLYEIQTYLSSKTS